ncbi:hypothetical protein HMPREF1529_03061 [Microbacterium sp. oral taxon 186 str. F0373]|uniref:hypothetical protein n=1 Tax=Microbacterium sp. oral taxon 186 TaxID=712383 RepID=UPI0002586645|nr:hypothetical protein [Microbacterium sp. oral taxon 186]EIC06681.1 hypothetical protein OR221_3205 [Microbacterium laevaniformans OR221]EPD83023.1 hypothetical protein HMPREF1529_03061 [Microbacterium sp. oral taxon 186 str. F0373]
MNAQPASPRRQLWLWIAAAATVLVIVAAAVGLSLANGPRDDAGPQPGQSTQPSTTPSAPASSAPPAAAGVDGCLGGDSRSPQAVLDAQAKAPHTPEGAVSFAITFARWGTQKPVVPDDEIARLDGVVITASNFAESVKTLSKLEQAQVHVTSLNGFYRVNTFTTDRVELTLMLPLVISGAIDPTLNFMPSYVVEWTERGWVITGGTDVTDANTLRTTGVAIPGGC